jgi:hypothetical protein
VSTDSELGRVLKYRQVRGPNGLATEQTGWAALVAVAVVADEEAARGGG